MLCLTFDLAEEKDLGIPSKFPFKDQILAEAADFKAKVDFFRNAIAGVKGSPNDSIARRRTSATQGTAESCSPSSQLGHA